MTLTIHYHVKKFIIKLKSHEDNCVNNFEWLFLRRVLESMIITHVGFYEGITWGGSRGWGGGGVLIKTAKVKNV